MSVFTMLDPANPMRHVDLFKKIAGRPQDLADIEALRKLSDKRKKDE